MNEGAYVEGAVAGGARSGALSMIDVPPLEEEGRPVFRGGWYAREGGLGGLVGLVSAALAKRCRAASKASFALARAVDRGVGRVGDVLSAPGKRRMLSLCVGVSRMSSS